MTGVAALLAGFALLAVLLAWSRWLAHRRWAAVGHVLLAVTAGCGALLSWSMQQSLRSYEPVIHGQPVAELYVEKIAARRYRGTLTRLPAGRVQVFELPGEQWRLEARTLDWQGRAAELGLGSRYRLERLGSRRDPRSIAGDAPGAAETASYRLGADDGDDLWAKARTGTVWARHLRGGRADGPWQPLAGDARFTVWLEPGGLRVEPANESATASLHPAR